MQKAISAYDTPSAEPVQKRSQALVALADKLRSYNYRFTTVSPLTHACNNERQSDNWAHDMRDIFGWSRPFLREMVAAEDFDLMLQAGILRPWAEGWRSSIRWSSLGDLLLSHSAYPTSDTDAVFFGPDTYRFVAAVQQWLAITLPKPLLAADIGCGSGAGAITLAKALPGCRVVASDVNSHALQMAEINAQVAAAPNVEVRFSNLLDDIEGDIDLIIANPPYMMDAQERAYRHGGGELGSGLSIRIVESALARLQSGGTLLLYTGVAIVDGNDCFLTRLTELLEDQNCRWSYRELDPDVFSEELRRPMYAAVERIAAVFLVLTLE